MLKDIQIFDIWEQSSDAYSGFCKVSHFSQTKKACFLDKNIELLDTNSIKILNGLQLLANRSMVRYWVAEHFNPGIKNVMQPCSRCTLVINLPPCSF